MLLIQALLSSIDLVLEMDRIPDNTKLELYKMSNVTHQNVTLHTYFVLVAPVGADSKD